MRAYGLAALATAILASAGQGAGVARTFAYGVAAGDVTTTGVLLWTRAPSAGPVRLEVRGGGKKTLRRTVTARADDDLTVTVAVSGLKPATRYAYRFRQGSSASATGRFTTAPPPSARARVRFAVSGDADGTPGADGKPAYNRFQVYARMAAEKNDFNINLGDTIYSDSTVGRAKPALTVAEKWAKYRQNLSLAALPTMRAAAATYSHWDDHEFVNDFSRAEHTDALYRAGARAFSDYAPVRPGRLGLYRTARWGKAVELFFLDERSFRSAKPSADGACDVAGQPDLAPTAPAATREAFTLLAPPLGQPVPPACLAAIDDPARTMLGRAQLTRFLRDVTASDATFKVVVNETPLMQLYALPYDRWEGYAAERRRVIGALGALDNVVVLTTDTHANLVGEVRPQTLEPGGPKATGITEIVAGPVATNTYAKEIDAVLGRPGIGQLVAAAFLKPPPPTGLGLRCVSVDTYAYAQVDATTERLTVRLKDLRGEPVRDVLGAPCPPVVVRAR